MLYKYLSVMLYFVIIVIRGILLYLCMKNKIIKSMFCDKKKNKLFYDWNIYLLFDNFGWCNF